MSISRARFRASLAAVAVLLAGVTCTEGTGPIRNRVSVALAPSFSQAALSAWSNVVSSGLSVDNIHIQLDHADGSTAKDTVVAYAGEDSLVIEIEVEIKGSNETLGALVEMRDGTLVLFSGENNVLAVAGAIPQTPPEVKMEFAGPGATVTSIDIAPADSTIIAVQDSVVFRPTAKDQSNQTVADFALLWSLTDSTIGTVSSTGVFRGTARGQTRVIARTYKGVKDTALVTVSLPGTKLIVISGNAQTGVAGGTLPQPVVIEAQASDNLPVPGVVVTFVPPPNTTPAQTTFTTNANGRITVNVPVNTVVGASNFQFTAPGHTAASLTATAIAGAPFKLAMTQQPSTTATSGTALATQPKVQLQDKFGNIAAVAGKTVLAALTTPAGRSLTGTVSVNTDASGIATYAGLTITGPSGATTLTFTHDTLTPATSSTITLSAGAPASLIAESPLAFVDSIQANVAAGNLAAVRVKDAQGAGVPGVAVKFRRHGGLGSQMNGLPDTVVTITTGADGIAKLSSQRLRDSIGVDSLFVTTAGLTDTVKFLAGVLNGAPHHLAVLLHPTDAVVGDPIPVIVVVQDRLNNITSLLSGTPPDVTLAIKSGTGTAGAVLSPNPSALTQSAAGGIASYTVSINVAGTGYKLTASAAGFTTVETDLFDLTPDGPNLVSWINPSGGNWSVGANWSTGVAPTSADHALITLAGTYTVTLDVNTAVAGFTLGAGSGLQTLTSTSHTLTIDGPSVVESTGALILTTSTVNGAGSLGNLGLIRTHGASTISAELINSNGATLRVQGQSSGSNASLTVVNGFDNSGLIELTSVGGGFSASMSVTNGTLINNSDGTINSAVGAGGSRTLAAQLVNDGSITTNQNLTLNKSGAQHVNNGTITSTSANLVVTLTGTTPKFTNTGSIVLGASRDISISGGTSDFTAGTVSGPINSTFIVSSSALAFTTFNILVPVNLAGASTIVGGAINVTSGQTLRLLSGVVSSSLSVQSGGTLLAHSNVSVTGTLSNAGTIKVQGQSFGSNATMTVSNGFLNNGVIELTSADGGFSSTLNVSTGTLVNGPGGTIHTLVGAGGARTLGAALINQGTLDVDQPLTISSAGAAHANSGLIDLTVANLVISQSGSIPSFTNTGSITLGASRDFTVQGTATLDLSAGTITGPVTSRLISNTQTLSFTTSTVTVPMNLLSTTIVGGVVNIPNTETLTLIGGGLTDAVSIASGGTLLTLGTVSLGGAVTLPAGGTLRVRGQSTGSNAALTVANGFTNSGLIDLTSADGGFSSTLTVTSGTLVNASGATIHSVAGAGGARTLAAQLDNQGTLDVDQALTLTKSGAVHVNSGLIDLTVTDFTVTQTGASPSFTNSGSITLGASRDFTVSGGTLDLSAGTVSGPATAKLAVSSSTLAFSTTTVTIPMTLTTTSISGGSVTIPTGQTLTLLNGGLSDPVSIANGGTLLTLGSVALNGAVTLATGGTLRPRGQSTGSNSSLTIANGFTNNGLIELISADGGFSSTISVTNGTLTNAAGATIRSSVGAGGSRTITAQLDNAGTLDVDQPLILSKADADHVNSGAIDLTVANLTLNQTGPAPSFVNTGTVTLGANRDFTVTGAVGVLDLSAGTVSGPLSSTLIVTGQTLSFSTTTVTVPMTLTTTTTGGTITIPTGQTLILLNGGLSDPVTIANGGTLLTHGSVSLTGAVTLATGGTLRPRGQSNGSNATLTIANGFTNNGLIELTSADGGFSSTLNVTNGTLTNASGATIHTAAGAGGSRTIAAQLNNIGTLDVDQDVTINKASAAHTNSGAIDLTVADLQVSQSGTSPSFANTGTVTLAAGRTWTVNNGTLDLSTGSVTGTVTSRLTVNGATMAFTPSTVGIPMTLTTTSISGGSLTIGTSQTVTLINGGLSDPVTVSSGGTLLTHGTVSLTGALAISGGNVRVRGQSTGSNATLTVANGFTNNGLIELTSADGGFSSTFAVTNGTLTNAGTGLIHSVAGAGGARTLAAQINNQGTIDVDAALTLNRAESDHNNTGTIDASVANFTVSQSGTSPTFNNGGTGTVTLGASRDLTVNGGFADFGQGSVTGPVSASFVGNNATLNFTPATITVPLTLTNTTIQGGTVSIDDAETVTLLGGTLSAAVTVESGGLLLAHGTSAATNLAINPGGTLEVRGQSSGSNAAFTVANGFTNYGTITLTSANGGFTSALNVTSGTLTNENDGVIQSVVGAGGSRTIGAQIDNQGTINVNAALTLSKADADHLNSGLIDLGANMTVTQTGTSPSFTNSGTIDLATKQLTVGGGVLTNAGGDPSGTIQGPGTLVVTTAAFTNHGNMTPGGILNVTGNYVQDVTNGGTNIDIAGTVLGSGYGQVAVSGAATLSGALNVALNAFTPILGQTFTVMTYASKTGVFSQLNLPGLTTGLEWVVVQGATGVTLTVALSP
jgi:fibronectin-binding autotransporter adhesin